MIRKFNLSLLVWDAFVDAVLVEHSVLGPVVRFSERVARTDSVFAEIRAKVLALGISDVFVSVSVPRDSVLIRTLSYPIVVKESLSTMLPMEANRHLPLPENDRAIAWCVADDGDDSLLLELAAIKQSALTEILAPFGDAGFEVSCALPISTILAQRIDPNPTLLLISDSTKIELCLCGLGLVRESVLLKDFSTELVIETAQKMMARNGKWLGEDGVSKIIYAGTSAPSDDLQNALSISFGLTANPLSVPKDFEAVSTVESLMMALNSLPESLNLTEAGKHPFKMSRRSIIITSLAAILFAQLIAFPILYANAPRFSMGRLNQEIGELRRDARDIEKLKNEVRSMRDELSALEDLSEDSLTMMQMLKVTSDTISADSYATQIQFVKGESMRIQGLSKNASALNGELLKLPFVADITKSDSKERPNSEYSSFNISLTLKEMPNE